MEKQEVKKKKDKFFLFFKKHKKIRFCSIVLGSCLGLFFLTNFGRYVKNIIDNYLSKTQEFYFNSNKLTEDGKKFVINYWSGTDDYDVNIELNSLANDLKGVDIDIKYDLSCTASEGATCTINNNAGVIKGTNSGGNNKTSFIATMHPTALFKEGDSVSITVTAVASEPYAKTLSASFTFVVGYYNINYSIEDEAYQPYLNVLITNGLENYVVREAFGSYKVNDNIGTAIYETLSDEDKLKCSGAEVTLDFDPRKYRLDMTNSNYLNNKGIKVSSLDGFDYVNELKFAMDPMSSTIVKFYKINVEEDNTYPLGESDVPVISFNAE